MENSGSSIANISICEIESDCKKIFDFWSGWRRMTFLVPTKEYFSFMQPPHWVPARDSFIFEYSDKANIFTVIELD